VDFADWPHRQAKMVAGISEADFPRRRLSALPANKNRAGYRFIEKRLPPPPKIDRGRRNLAVIVDAIISAGAGNGLCHSARRRLVTPAVVSPGKLIHRRSIEANANDLLREGRP